MGYKPEAKICFVAEFATVQTPSLLLVTSNLSSPHKTPPSFCGCSAGCWLYSRRENSSMIARCQRNTQFRERQDNWQAQCSLSRSVMTPFQAKSDSGCRTESEILCHITVIALLLPCFEKKLLSYLVLQYELNVHRFLKLIMHLKLNIFLFCLLAFQLKSVSRACCCSLLRKF